MIRVHEVLDRCQLAVSHFEGSACTAIDLHLTGPQIRAGVAWGELTRLTAEAIQFCEGMQ